MQTIEDRIVLITGASSGIGMACAESFAAAGARLILCARRIDRLDELAIQLRSRHDATILTRELDVRDRIAVQHTLDTLPDDWKTVDVLINNAGLARGYDKLHEGDMDDWEEMIDTNVKGLLWVSRCLIPGMVERQRGLIINIGSIAGHDPYPRGAVYNATKFAVDAITRALRMELVDTPLRVSSVDPGLVETEFSFVRFRGDATRAAAVYQEMEVLAAWDVAEAVLFCATRPPHVSVNQIIITPTAQATSLVKHVRSRQD
ncbi:MAG: SDR family NAD(P)-dependent oxidoreductase [Bacteroidetes bacterium]|nr:SDR family NAD(P)-dependent oxidoreductase [Bacteroidota bacterium]